ncbi:EF-hand domain-containing protein [Streptomyces goshikiensis]|uniref:EF-hand domain-containing protein n=1 Tax=Streptomyces goshikiensis TaxID=1942 RepID=UPI003720B576
MSSTTGVLEQKLRRFFAMLDLDGDGRLAEDDALAVADRLAMASTSRRPRRSPGCAAR